MVACAVSLGARRDWRSVRVTRVRLSLFQTAAKSSRQLQGLFILATFLNGVTLALEVEPRTPPLAHDADQMEQVILNLVKNAIEASPRGAAVKVRVGKAVPGAGATSRRGPAVSIEVVDQGCGIPPEHQKTMFEPFFTTKPGGSGLGLYISHDIVKRHGGAIAVHSDPGQGTTFVVELPLENSGGTA